MRWLLVTFLSSLSILVCKFLIVTINDVVGDQPSELVAMSAGKLMSPFTVNVCVVKFFDIILVTVAACVAPLIQISKSSITD